MSDVFSRPGIVLLGGDEFEVTAAAETNVEVFEPGEREFWFGVAAEASLDGGEPLASEAKAVAEYTDGTTENWVREGSPGETTVVDHPHATEKTVAKLTLTADSQSSNTSIDPARVYVGIMIARDL